MANKKNTKRKNKDLQMNKKLDEKFKELGEIQQERFGNERIEQLNVADADYMYSCLFGANKNLYRTTARLQDGIKPGRGRLYYTWWLREGRPQDTKPETLRKLKFYKVSVIAGTVMDFHPHGDSATQELIGREGQYWSNNVMSIVPQGSYGNMRGDDPAAGRYITAKMSEYMIDCFFSDFDKYCVPMKLGYDGRSYEPEFLPAKYPHILFNPQFSGIGYGLASNIPPFNVTEVLDATIKLIKDPDAKIMLVPDSPTGADIIDEGNFKEINKSGQSKLTMRAKVDIDYVENTLHITSLPMNSSSSQVINKIISMKDKKLFDDITKIDDSTKEGEVDIRIYLKNTAKPEKILEELYKKGTGLKSTFPVGITVIDDYMEYEYGVKDLLLEWIAYRVDIVRSMLLNSLQILLNKQHMNEVLLMVFSKDNIDETVKIAKSSASRKDTISKLMKRFGITSLQAGVIADMHVYNFNADSYERYKKDKEDLKEEIEKTNEILLHDDKIDQFIIDQLEEGKKKYGHPRKSKIIKEKGSEPDIPNTDHLVGISESGFIKKLSLENNSSIGPVGKTTSAITVLQVNNRESVLVVDSSGMLSKVSISAIPDMEFTDNGIELSRFFSVTGEIRAVMELPSMEILKQKDENLCIIFITKKGYAKRVQISDFKKLTKSKPGIILNDGDELAVALFSFDKTTKDIVICTNTGDGIRLPISEIRTLGSSSKGNQMLSLKNGEYVVGASKINPKKKLLFYITSSGRGKITETKYFPVMKRGDKVLSLISLVGNETLLGVSSVDKGDIVTLYHKKTEPENLNISDLEVSTRASKGDKISKTPNGDFIVAYKTFVNK